MSERLTMGTGRARDAMDLDLAVERGSALVEFAFILPILLFLLLGTADFGMVLQAQAAVANAAREGARAAVSSNPSFTSTQVGALVTGYLGDALPSGSATPTTTVTSCVVAASGQYATMMKVNVSLVYTYRFVGGVASLLGRSFSTITLTGTAAMRKEIELADTNLGLPTC
jgi:Flp pilus assembly protein TadG